MLALWLPATNHCRLETLPGLDFLLCDASAPGDLDCEGDACGPVEKVPYKSADSRVVLVDIPALIPAIATAVESQPQIGITDPITFVDPPPPWQFSLRAAKPPRAPSFAS
jgi:hypothetical protein